MYEDLTFGDLTTAKSVWKSSDDVKTLDEASVEHNDRLARLEVSGIGESPKTDVFVDLTGGEVDTARDSVHSRRFTFEDANVDVSEDEMTITVEREAEVITLSVECEGEVTEDSGPDLERFGVDI